MIKILPILLLIFCSSCQSWPSTAFDIANEPYHLTDNNCVHKAKKFIELEEGTIWVVRVPGEGLHAWVFLDDGWKVDPTNGIWLKEIKIGTPLYPWIER